MDNPDAEPQIKSCSCHAHHLALKGHLGLPGFVMFKMFDSHARLQKVCRVTVDFLYTTCVAL